MSRKEVVRPGLMKALVVGQLTNRQVAAALRVSIRHVQRLKGRFRAAGVAGLVHRTRGRPSHRRLAPALRQRVADLMQTAERPHERSCEGRPWPPGGGPR
jgi:transposase